MKNVFLKFFKIVSHIHNKEDKISTPKIIAKNRIHLDKLIKKEISKNGNDCNLNHIDVSLVTDMARLFNYIPKFNGNISKWNTANVENMFAMFEGSQFNGDISHWNVSKVWNMAQMFEKSLFNNDISDWNVSNVTRMERMFYHSNFTQNISMWQPYKLICTVHAFRACEAEAPYWIHPVSLSERIKIIDSHQSHMNDSLRNISDKLGVNLFPNSSIKIKIR